MHRPGHDWFDRLVAPEHLRLAASRAVDGKRRRPDVAWFLFRRTERLLELEARLRDGSWRPRGYTAVYLFHPKRRVISRASFEDRVVHSAIALLCEPVILRSATAGDFACRTGFGTHRAVLRLREEMRRHRFALHLDLKAYFPSIDLDMLRGQIEHRFRDERFLAVIDLVLESGRGLHDTPAARTHLGWSASWPPRGQGLPIGAVTSQLFAAHLYLQEFDHWVKRQLKVPGYVRYVDDLLLFGNRRAELRRWRSEIGEYLGQQLHLRLKFPTARLLSCAGHIDALGFRVRREVIEPLPATWRRLRGAFGDFVRGFDGRNGSAELARSLVSRRGILASR